MTSATLAVIIAVDGRRFKLRGWRGGSHKTSEPKRPAALSLLTEKQGWKGLESWQGAVQEATSLWLPKPDPEVLSEGLDRLRTTYGVTVEKIVLKPGNSTNHMNNPVGWGYETRDLELDDGIEVVRQ